MKVTAFELAARYIYPSLKRRLAQLLYERGLSQTRIAALLGASQSSISRYLSEQRGVGFDPSRYPDVEALLSRIAEVLVEKGGDEYLTHCLLTLATIEVLRRGYACELHARLDKGLDPERCRLCLRLFERVSLECLGEAAK